ncbi:nucleoside diphosphate-linked moiety X motif 17 isoform X2 [Xenopus tropicalis]|uniref:Nucleoside diphosphate-linked moiety X motif 17 isoform X2 n=1 Tax=Xenopus tropicalis TaxID=8364 RepID=A0A8J1IMP8_XENTR|nr:nucleoside diphosphate-linked moiety X motif 17 isoform X2 [Xenopus tropicalis]
MESAKRVLVCLTKENSLLQCAKFVQGITGQYSANNGDKALIHCGLDRNQFVISDRQFPSSAPVQLQRPSFCPIKNLSPTQAAALPGEIRNRGVDVGVAVLVQSVNKKVLLTRRSKSLNIFPNVWVPPGGHVEPGEQSAFPPLLSQGLPSRHHIVTYLLVQSNQTHQQLQERLCPDEREVSACVWLDTEIAKCIVAAEDDAKDSGKPQGPAPATIRVSELINGSLSQSDRSMATFLSTAPKEGEAVERISTGTKYALSLWLETLPKAPSREHE